MSDRRFTVISFKITLYLYLRGSVLLFHKLSHQVIKRYDDGWFVGTSQRTKKFCFLPVNYILPSEERPRDVITTPRDVITTTRDVITTTRDVITTPRDIIAELVERLWLYRYSS